MTISRRELVRLGSVLGGVAVATAAQREGRAGEQQAEDDRTETHRQGTAKGTVASYSEGFDISFTLSEMPEGITLFGVDSRVTPHLGRLLLAAAEKGWEVHVAYTISTTGTEKFAKASRLTVKDFRRH